jgi:hypothetical protein
MPEVTQSFLDDLNARINRAERKADDLDRALRQARKDRQLVLKERDQLKAQLGASQPEETPPSSAAPIQSPPDSDLVRENAELKAWRAEREHRDTFRAVALERGVSPKAVEDLYLILQLKPGDKPPKPEDFVAVLDQAKEARPWAFGSEPPASSQAPTPAGKTPPVAPAGAGRSASAPSVGSVKYRLDEVSRPGWQQSRPELVEALKEGRAVLER